jgi:cytochrome c oxidase subunit II
MSVKVTGYQWFWEYEYLDDDKNPDNNIRFFSKLDEDSNKVRQLGTGTDPRSVSNYLLNVDKPLVIPVNKKVRFLFTSKDVIHSWWVPEFGWKKDANPGFINEAWTLVTKPGTYRGQCTELCGKDHGFMPVVVIAMEQADYDKWLKKQGDQDGGQNGGGDTSKDDLMAAGQKVYEQNCASCHLADGKGVPGTFPPMTKSPIVTGSMEGQLQIMINGKGMMPAFGKNKMLNAKELAQVITYTRNALGNKVGDEIQPKAVQEALGGKAAPATEAKAEEKDAKADSESEKAAEKTEEKAVEKSGKAAKKAEKTEKTAEMSKEDLIAAGKSVYEKNCASCHMPDGAGLPGTFPALKGSEVVTGDINKQVDMMLSGKGMMPAFGSMLSAEEFAAVVTYTRNDLGNSVGDLIQPAAVKSLQSAKK